METEKRHGVLVNGSVATRFILFSSLTSNSTMITVAMRKIWEKIKTRTDGDS